MEASRPTLHYESADTHVLVGIDCPACGIRRVRAFRRRPFRFDASCLCRSAFAILHRGADAPRFDDRDPKDLTPPNGWRLELPEIEDEVEVEDEPELAVAAGRRRRSSLDSLTFRDPSGGK